MSFNKKLSSDFGRTAPFCASQVPEAPATTPELYAAKWCSQPGFLDPFEVVYLCVRRLHQETYVRVKYFRRCDERLADKSQICPGLEVYFSELRQDPQVQKDLNEHIAQGSLSNLRFVIRNYCLDQVLLFLLKYLKERGPLMQIRYASLELLQQACSHSNTLAMAYLRSGYQHEFEYESIITIGSYLSYLLTVACAHDLFWVQDFLAELWGPLLVDFVNIGSSTSETMPDEQLSERRFSFMSRLLDSMPWDSLKRCESLRLTLGPNPDQQGLLRHGAELSRRMAQLQERPQALTATLRKNASNICALLDGPSLGRQSDQAGEERPDAVNEKLLMEKVALQENLPRANLSTDLDFSDQYGYSEKHKAVYAPYGMCQVGM